MKKLYCITCPIGCLLTVIGTSFEMVVEGNKCDKGREFAYAEMSNPSRTLTTTVRTKFPGVPVLSVRTAGEIPRDKLMTAMRELSEVIINEELGCGDTVVENIAKTGVSVIVTSPALMQLGAELENKNAEIERRRGSGGPGVSSGTGGSGGIGSVNNTAVLDTLGMDDAAGFVGAAGEAVGVEAADDADNEETVGGPDEGRLKRSSRPHIKRK